MSPLKIAGALIVPVGGGLISGWWAICTQKDPPVFDWVGPMLLTLGILSVVLGIVWGGFILFQRSQHEQFFAGEGLPRRGTWSKFLDWALERRKPDDYGNERGG